MASGDLIMTIDTFLGLDQSADGVNQDVRTSPDMANFLIEDGKLTTSPGARDAYPALPATQGGVLSLMEAVYHGKDGKSEYRLVAGLGGNLYRLEAGQWKQMGAGYGSDRWDAVNYRKDTEEWHIITNGVDPVLYAAKDAEKYQEMEGVPAKGRYIALSDERLWLGGVDADPEVVYWSWDNDPNNWEVDLVNPEQGGGFLYARTHDGSKVVGIKALLNDVVIFKDRSLKRVTGSYPGEYQLIDVYGETGPISENTIVASGGAVYFLCGEGLCVYNGMTVQSLALSAGDTRLKDIAARINWAKAELACSVIFRGSMYIALPLDESATNNAVIVFDMTRGVYQLMEDYRADCFLVYHGEGRERLLMGRGGRVMEMAGDTDDGKPINARYRTPWFDAGTKSARKSSGRVYLAVEGRSLTEEKPRFKLTMESEKKKREKIIVLKRPGVNVLRPRVKLRGRVLRMGIETVDGTRLSIWQGVNVQIESDED